MKMMKLLILAVLGGLLFVAGFLAGRQEPERMRNMVERGKADVTDKASDLEREVRRLRQRMHQYSISRRLSSAQAALAEKNFGIMEGELEKAGKEVASLKALSPPEKSGALDRFEAGLDGLVASVRKGDRDLKERLMKLESDFEKTYED